MKDELLQHNAARWAMLLLVLFGRALGQTPGTGAISGVVYDPSNRVIANAEVLTVNEGTHMSRSAITTAEGVFRVPLLPPGIYTVTVKAAGFADHTSQSIPVTASETRSLNVTLTVSGMSTDVQASGDAEMADLESSTLGGLVNDRAVQSLPLSSRNFTQIMGLAPGVVVDLPAATALGNGTQNVASNGATPTANNIQFNGVDANNLVESSAATAQSFEVGVAVPAPDTIQEFRVQTANFDAAYGRGTGANVDLVSKSGTNRFHGSAWEFVRNDLFNANDFFSKMDGQPRAELKQNEFGGALGGPIRKDRTFFFGAYQGVTQANGLGDLVTTTLPALTSDRTAATLGALFCPAGHLDSAGQPATGYLTSAGGTQVLCDGSNINPVALKILNTKLPSGQFAVPNPQVLIPNTGADASDQMPTGQSTYSFPAHYREDQFTGNLDQTLSQRNTLAGRFFYSRSTTSSAFTPGGANVPGWGSNNRSRNTMFVLADTHVFNSNLVNIGRFGYMRYDGLSSVENPLTAQAVGMGITTGAADTTANMPDIEAGPVTIGDSGTPSQWQVTNSFIYQDTVAWTRGRHNARFGVELKRHEVDENQPILIDGAAIFSTFADFLLGESAAQNGSPQGLSNVSLGVAGGGIFRRNTRYTDYSGFAQDDVKLTNRLTLNAGLRYEIFAAPTDTTGRLANFDANTALQGPIPATGTFSGFTVPSNFPGVVPAGVTKTSYPSYYRTSFGDVSPRLGFAWQALEKPVVVVRGGFGFYYDQHSGNIVEQTLSQAPFALLQIQSGAPNGPATLQSPFFPLVPPSSSFPFCTPRTPSSTPVIEGTDPNLRDGLTQEYNLNVQFAMGHGYLLDVGYVGTRSLHRPGFLQFDQAALASPQNPVNGETTNSIGNVTNRTPIQGINPGSMSADSIMIGNYNSLQISLNKRMEHGFQLQANYTWSKNLDEVDGENGSDVFELATPTNNQHNLRGSSYGPAADDRDQRLVTNFIWSAPRFTAAPAVARRVLTGWEFSGIGVIQSGAAFSVFDGNAGSIYALIGNVTRAQATGKNPSTGGSLFSRVTNGYLDPAAFTRAPEAPYGTSLADQDFGNSGVGFVRGPGQHNIDMAVERLFPVTESHSFRFRVEFFNLTNTPQFAIPNNALGYTDPTLPNPSASPSFGKITGELDGPHPRIIQFAAKYQF
jgi:hypothetical protein